MRRLQPLIQERLDKLLERMREYGRNGDVLTISVAYVAFAAGRQHLIRFEAELF